MDDLIYQSALLADIEESVVFSVKAGQPSAEIRGANKITNRIKAAPAVDAEKVFEQTDPQGGGESPGNGGGKMSRYTKRLEDGQAVMDCKSCILNSLKECTALGCRNRIKDRLAAYEDTGMEPEEIRTVQECLASKCSGIEVEPLYDKEMQEAMEKWNKENGK